MPLPEDVTTGVTPGQIAAHNALHALYNADGLTPALRTNLVTGNTGHNADHTALKLWAQAAGVTVPEYVDGPSHELAHEALANWYNDRTGQTPPPPPTNVPPLTGPSGTLASRWLGGTTPTSFVVVVRTTNATQVRLKASIAVDLSSSPAYSNTATPDANGMSRLTVTGLTANTLYHYGIECGPALDSVKRGQCKTYPSGPASFSIAFGSCLNGGDSPVFARMQARDPAAFLILGDLWYRDGTSTSAQAYRDAYNDRLDRAALGALMSRIPTAYTPSDHDSGMANNFTGAGNQTVANTMQAVWRQYNPYWGPMPSSTGIYQTWVIGRVRIVMTDCRSFKSSTSASDNSSKTILGSTQKAWFKSVITAATEPVILWAQDIPWVGAASGSDDEWFGYNTERQELANHIKNSGKKVIILAGDAHMLAYDDGTNSAGQIPVVHSSPLSNGTSIKGGPYSGGTWPTSEGSSAQQYGMLNVVDTGGTSVSVTYKGYDSANAERKSKLFTFPASAVPVGGGGGTPPPPPPGTVNYNGWTPATRMIPPLLPVDPTAENTGVFDAATRAGLTLHNGNMTVTTANAYIRNMHITGELIIAATGVFVELCWIEGRVSGHESRPIFVHCDAGHVTPLTDTNDNFRFAVSVYRCNVFAGQDGIKPTGTNCVIQDNFFHDMLIQTDTGQNPPISHNDIIQFNDSVTNCRVIHNTFWNWGMNGFASPPQSCTRSSGPNWGEHTNDHAGGNVSSTIQVNGTAGGSAIIENNLFNGNPDWVINMGDPGPHMTIRGNKFYRSGQTTGNQSSGPITGESRVDVNQNNRYVEDNALIPGSSA